MPEFGSHTKKESREVKWSGRWKAGAPVKACGDKKCWHVAGHRSTGVAWVRTNCIRKLLQDRDPALLLEPGSEKIEDLKVLVLLISCYTRMR